MFGKQRIAAYYLGRSNLSMIGPKIVSCFSREAANSENTEKRRISRVNQKQLSDPSKTYPGSQILSGTSFPSRLLKK